MIDAMTSNNNGYKFMLIGEKLKTLSWGWFDKTLQNKSSLVLVGFTRWLTHFPRIVINDIRKQTRSQNKKLL